MEEAQPSPSGAGASPDVHAGCTVRGAAYMDKPPIESLGIQVS